ncbi:hypothetical protein EP47_07060 [Legionella norrlandica]|uniref:Uncharacterized protein n=1 Tax=Legionella norrlandica TaxID=1498499 RepID=A0A0A2SS33_9GAMM|nr:hypothetical protein [Legionella norrlandica]KGP63890.1 hypothetical protein EP47_07060 [Legionella norrlandica]
MELTNLTEDNIERAVELVFTQENNFNSVEEAYQKLARVFYENFGSSLNKSEVVLSRVYHSFDFQVLPQELQSITKEIWGEQVKDTSKILVLMGTYGQEEAWRDRKQSKGHKAILLSKETLERIPMVARLIQQIGFDIGLLLGHEEGIDYEGIAGTFGVFYVSSAQGSPYIPAQDFVEQYKVQSVIGTGVMLPQGDISVYLAFTRVPIKSEVAANIAPLMSIFWQKAYFLLEKYGMFNLNQ